MNLSRRRKAGLKESVFRWARLLVQGENDIASRVHRSPVGLRRLALVAGGFIGVRIDEDVKPLAGADISDEPSSWGVGEVEWRDHLVSLVSTRLGMTIEPRDRRCRFGRRSRSARTLGSVLHGILPASPRQDQQLRT
jgi:hypothetical protein